ncbi:DUF1796 family putative cysteine peptidase [Burkholderia sp. BCC1999]|uniref:DUF1796 family putative cysteine peptidase n=1 Tax=Burkholderia sp. BCC1999 TaxID=2817448 RepID=UPI002AC36D98|nr:DUF1796 family putative cysteine peptidase [Burkholderia sp. BCC1999]
MNSVNQDSDLIKILYRQLVGREADPAGLIYHEELLRGQPDIRVREELVRGMMQSDEASNHLVRHLYLRASPDPFLKSQEIVSLGTHCFTSYLLKSFGLKAYSGPFDWLFSSPAMIEHCLIDNFGMFLDQSYYEPVPLERRRDGANVNKVDHRFYRNEFGVNYVFNHHDVHMAADYGYVTRCVNRFRASAASDRQKIYLLVRKESVETSDHFDQVAAAVDRTIRNGVLVYVSVGDRKADLPEVTVRGSRGRHRLLSLKPISKWNALTFEDVLDEVTILKSIGSVLKESR